MKVNEQFNDWSISKELFDFIRQTIPVGSTILELGSGYGTKALSMWYTMYSIEDDPKFVNLFNSTYCHAPIKQYDGYQWYDDKVVGEFVKDIDYDLLLIDAPIGAKYGRSGFLQHTELFNMNVPVVVDDTHRDEERMLSQWLFDMYPFREILRIPDPKKEATVLIP